MNIFIADPGADCFSTLPAPKMIDKAANECRRRSCYNFFFFFFFFAALKTAEISLGPEVMSFWRKEREEEEEERLTLGEVK